jgi:hypothetical protein
MVQVGTKFSSKPRNGYDFIYEITEVDGNFIQVRNTSFPEYDERGKQRLKSLYEMEQGFINGDYIVLK